MYGLILRAQNELINGRDPRVLGLLVAVSRLGFGGGRYKRSGAPVSTINMVSILLQRGR